MTRLPLRLAACAALMTAGSAGAALVPSANLGAIDVPGTRAFGDSDFAPGTVDGQAGSYGSDGYNFIDDFSFTLRANASLATLVAAINFRDAGGQNVLFGVSNLQVNLSGPSGLFVSWRDVTSPASGLSSEVALIRDASLLAGDYTLRVRGQVSGTGSYSGSLNALGAVPLPATLPLFALGTLLLGSAAGLRRRDD